MPALNLESGQRPNRLEYVAETTFGLAPANPTWLRFSDCPIQIGPYAPNANIFVRRCIGDSDPDGFDPGAEDHGLQIQYYLQKALASDAWADGAGRDADENVPASHTVVSREKKSTNGGILDAGVRTYTVAKGCIIDRAALQGTTQDGRPIISDLQYVSEKARSYELSQLDVAAGLTVESTSTADTTQTVTIEDDVPNSEGVVLNGTTPVPTVKLDWQPDSLDSVSLNTETVGDVLVKKAGTGEVLMTLRGSAFYAGAEGDLGIPPLGSGSHASAVGTPYESYRAATVERPGGTPMAFATSNLRVEVQNGVESIPLTGLRKGIAAGDRSTRVQATTFGPQESHRRIEEHLGAVANNIVVTLGGGSIVTVLGAVLMQPGARQYGLGQASMQLNNNFEGKGLTIA